MEILWDNCTVIYITYFTKNKMNREMTTLRVGLVIATISGALVGCGAEVNDGDTLIVTRDTDCWQCPGGDNLSSFSRVYECANQRNRGTIELGSKVNVTTNDDNYFLDKGYYRVTGSVLDPVTGERLEKICWADGSDLKK